MALKYCVTDWRSSWTAMQKRRRCELQSVWLSHTTKPIANVPAIVPWSWNSLVGDEAVPIVWNSNPNTLTGVWTQFAVSQGWHLMDSGNGPQERLIYSDPPFSSYACDMRINACADALADYFMDYAGLQWGLNGVHLDYYVNPVDLGATSFTQAAPNGWAGDQAFKDAWNAGIGRFADRIRTRHPEWWLVAQRDHPLVTTDPRLPAINGYFLEQFIGKFLSFQTSFATVKQWIADHKTWLDANRAGRPQVWIIEYGQAGQDLPGTLNSVALPALTEVTGGQITNRDQFLKAHLDLCEETGAYFSYDRDRKNQYAGHTPLPGMTTRIERVRPTAAGQYSEWSPGAGGYADLADQNESTFITSSTQNQRHLVTLPLPTLAPGENILDWSLGIRSKKTGGTTTDTQGMWRAASTDMTGRDHRLLTTGATSYEENIAHPTADWTNTEAPNLGVKATNSAGTRDAIEVFGDVTIETVGGPWGGIREDYTSRRGGGKIRPRRR